MLKNLSLLVLVVFCLVLVSTTAQAERPRAYGRSILGGPLQHDGSVGHENLYADGGGRLGARVRAWSQWANSPGHASNLRAGVGAGPLRTRVVGTRATGVTVVGRKFFGR